MAVLLAALVIQCGIVAAAYWPAQSPQGAAAGEVFAPFSPGDIDRLTIGDEYDNEVVLTRSGTRWVIPGLYGLPADGSRIDALLEGLTAGNHGWPIARSPSAQQRFQVAQGNYQRRLDLAADGENAGTLYLGTSPGFGKVHARNGEQDAVFSIALNNFDIPAVAGKWLDPRLLQVRVPVRIDTDLYHLRFEDGTWLTGNGNTPDDAALLTLLTVLKTIQVLGVADEDQARNLAGLEANLIMNVESLAGTVTFELLALGERHFIHSSEYPLFFRISQPDYTRLAEIDLGLISAE
jgi:hypothetical protein